MKLKQLTGLEIQALGADVEDLYNDDLAEDTVVKHKLYEKGVFDKEEVDQVQKLGLKKHKISVVSNNLLVYQYMY